MGYTTQESIKSRSSAELDREMPLEEALSDQEEELKEISDKITFPEGGARAWFVAAGAAGVMFCTLGYINSFGLVKNIYRSRVDRVF